MRNSGSQLFIRQLILEQMYVVLTLFVCQVNRQRQVNRLKFLRLYCEAVLW